MRENTRNDNICKSWKWNPWGSIILFDHLLDVDSLISILVTNQILTKGGSNVRKETKKLVASQVLTNNGIMRA